MDTGKIERDVTHILLDNIGHATNDEAIQSIVRYIRGLLIDEVYQKRREG